MKYFIVANRAFNSRKEAEKFCIECDFDFSCIIETIPTKKRYFEMCTESSDRNGSRIRKNQYIFNGGYTMEKIRCTRNEMHEILTKAVSDCYAGKMTMQEYNALEFDIIPIDFSRFPKLKADTAEYINKEFDEETTDRNGNFMLRGRVYDSLSLWFRDKEKLHLNYAPYGFYYSGFGFNDEEWIIYTWCEGDTTVTLFEDEETYLQERAETEKWYEENT